MSKSGQKFIARNRAPRVQIEYDVELYGAEKTIQLPFVMGVMSDLSGKSETPLPAVADRKFLEIDVDNFDDRMKAIRPRAAFTVPNTLTGEGNLAVDMTFERMEDFSPAAVAEKVEPLKKLLEARTQLQNLVTYMDGKTGAEDLIARLIAVPAMLSSLLANSEAPDETSTALEDLRSTARPAAPDAEDTTSATLAALAAAAPAHSETMDNAARVLDDLKAEGCDDPEPADTTGAILADLAAATPEASEDRDNTDDVLGGLAESGVRETRPVSTAAETLAQLSAKAPAAAPDTRPAAIVEDALTDPAETAPDDDAADEDVSAAILYATANKNEQDRTEPQDVDQNDVMSFVESVDDATAETEVDEHLEPLADDVVTDDGTPQEAETDALDALLAGSDDDLDTAYDEEDLADPQQSDDTDGAADVDNEPTPHGTLDLDKPEDRDAPRDRFRLAILGDFTGRGARGDLEIGDPLGRRKPIKFDVDTIDDIIARFATTLILPIGKDGAGVEVRLESLDDLHPDELYESVEVFQELAALRQRVAMGDGKKAIAVMQGWAETFGELSLAARPRARGTAVPADRKLSAFRALIGDSTDALRTASPAEDLIQRIVGPFVQKAPDPEQTTMLAAVDAAMSGTMRAILHHPDFQAVESTWRSLDLLARRITTGAGLEVVLYDVSAEEWAADLAAEENLANTGLFKMLAEEPRLDDAQGPLSAICGLYTLEEIPPHADLIGRMAKISDWMNAPFLAAISPQFLNTPKHERHPLVAKAWDNVRTLPEAAYAGLVAPRFLLRLPYGAKTEPVDPFDFEEFSLREGLKGMLWANPVVLSAILMCETVNQQGKAMKLGQVMSIGDMPFHYMTDQHGDQVALPCTERLLTTRSMAKVVARGYMPLLSIKGRNEVRQGSFQALGPGLLAGPWGLSADAGGGMGSVSSGLDVTRDAPESSAAPDEFRPSRPGGAGEDYDEQWSDDEEEDEEEDDDFALEQGSDAGDDGADDEGNMDFDLGDASDEDDESLDDLLAGFGDDADDDADDEDSDYDMDPELAALLGDL